VHAVSFAAAPERSLARWTAGVPAERRARVVHGWRRVLEVPGAAPAIPALRGEESGLEFLAVATEWRSHHGGVSTFNRELCLALARAGHRVACLVPHGVDADLAREAGDVQLVPRPPRRGESEYAGLSIHEDLPFEPDFVIGHGRITGAPARRQASYARARRVHFFHMSPEEIEPIKALNRPEDPRDPNELAEERRAVELDLSRDAALVAAVGPKLYDEIEMALRGPGARPPIHRFDPGFTAVPDDGPHPPPLLWVLVMGRVEDYYLKGLDLAAATLGRITLEARARYGHDVELVVRGTRPQEGEQCRALLRKDAGTDIRVRIRNFSTDGQALASDVAQASVVLMPSRTEGFGLVGLEAIASGRPVIVCQDSGLGRLLEEHRLDRGVVLPRTGSAETDAKPWARAIDLALHDRGAASLRAAELRAALAPHCRWEDAARKLAGALRALGPVR
jgi:glycosyltransferase involved in cell wall biosynthesis